MEYDVVVVGGGPAGLATAIKLRQLAVANEVPLSVCILEKGSEIGAHIISGAVIEPRALVELFPDISKQDLPLDTPVTSDQFHFLTSDSSGARVPGLLIPPSMHNTGNYIASLGNVCRWLGEQAESLEVDIFPGFAATEILYNSDTSVKGVATGDMGIAANGEPKESYEPGIELHARYTVFAEGCRGHLGKELIGKFDLARDTDPQHYALGFKELWEIDESKHRPGLVMHGAGWPLAGKAGGGFFLYHFGKSQVAVGMIADLGYQNPYFDPYEEFQQFKQHPLIAGNLKGGSRISYGARAIAKGGLNSLVRLSFPGGLIIGCDAGTLNFAKIKGSHTAMKSGILAAETLFKRLADNRQEGNTLSDYDEIFRNSWLYDELYRARNFGPALNKFGLYLGSIFNFIDQSIFRGRLPFTLHDRKSDHERIQTGLKSQRITYPKPDGVLSFDRLSSIYLSNTNHEEDQPCHLVLKDQGLPLDANLPIYAGPEQRYCPAGVYEYVEEQGAIRFRINAQNCIHCKTCDIKDPYGNIRWTPPEGGGGPNYSGM